jgi:hypothetical protein
MPSRPADIPIPKSQKTSRSDMTHSVMEWAGLTAGRTLHEGIKAIANSKLVGVAGG